MLQPYRSWSNYFPASRGSNPKCTKWTRVWRTLKILTKGQQCSWPKKARPALAFVFVRTLRHKLQRELEDYKERHAVGKCYSRGSVGDSVDGALRNRAQCLVQPRVTAPWWSSLPTSAVQPPPFPWRSSPRFGPSTGRSGTARGAARFERGRASFVAAFRRRPRPGSLLEESNAGANRDGHHSRRT